MLENGYLKVPGRVAKTGVQEYLASEIGATDIPPNQVVKVFRPPDEVFKAESLESYRDADVTLGHPGDLVNADSYKDVTVGHTTSEGRPDGNFVTVDLLIKDKAAIKAVEDGIVELSAGYKAEYEYAPGKSPDGEDYEYIQRHGRINHIALVERARAGREARVYDHERGNVMTTITLDGQSIEVADKSTAALIQKCFDAESEKMKDMEEKLQKAKDEYESMKKQMDEYKAKADKAAEDMAEKEKETSDEAIAARIKTVTETRDQAIKIAGESFTCDSVNPLDIKREALAKARPTMDWANQSEAYIEAAWDMAISASPEDRTRATHDAFGADLAKLYTGDDGRMVGTAAYDNFLKGGAK